MAANWDFTDCTLRPRKPDAAFEYCGMCNGRGYVRVEPYLNFRMTRIDAHKCNVCGGQGYRAKVAA